jgi:hypothetical protein
MGFIARAVSAAMTFALHFHEHVLPRLRNLAKAEGVCVAKDVETYSGACSAVMRYANKFGALTLDPELIDELYEWVQLRVGEAIEEAEAEGAR